MISQVLFTSEHRAACETLKINHFSVNCYRYRVVVFGTIYSTCVVHTKTIAALRLGKYPPLFSSTSVNNIVSNYCLLLLAIVSFSSYFDIREFFLPSEYYKKEREKKQNELRTKAVDKL